MNDKRWDTSRKVYIAYRENKRRLNRASREHIRSFKKLQATFARFTRAQSDAILKYKDASQVEKFTEAYENLREAKLAHDASLKEITAAIADFKKKEIGYTVVIFKGLRNIGVSMTDISNVFGVWMSHVTRLFKHNKKDQGQEQELEDMYDDEFGE